MRLRHYGGALFLVCTFSLLGFWSSMARAESARSLTAQGNEHYVAGEYKAALKAYEQAESEQPEAPAIHFNKGNVWFQQGDLEKAKGAYEAAALKAEDLSLEAKCQFNMGDVAFSQGQTQLSTDPKGALEAYRKSLGHFKEALRLGPQLREAAENLELVRLKMKQLEEQLKQRAEEERRQQNKETCENPEAVKDGNQEREHSANKESEKEEQQPQEASQAGSEAAPDVAGQKSQPETPSAGQEQPEKQERAQRTDQAEAEKMSEAELAKDILREEKELRLQRDRTQRQGYHAVEKDW